MTNDHLRNMMNPTEFLMHDKHDSNNWSDSDKKWLQSKERRHQVPPGECKICDSERAANNKFHPPHDASSRCESGKHSHCSCDVCF